MYQTLIKYGYKYLNLYYICLFPEYKKYSDKSAS